MKLPLVSIITPTFNSEKFIIDTYKSISAQSYINWEWVVTDDCSNDNTIQVLYKIREADDRVKVHINDKNLGAAWSRNCSLEHAQGCYFAFIDSDDIWYPNKLKKQMEFMLENDVEFSFTAYELINENGKKLNKVIDSHHKNKVFSYNDMLYKKATLGCSTAIISRELVGSKRMPNIRTAQDYAFWLSILKDNNRVYLIPFIGTQYRIVASSISRNKIKKAKRQWEVYRQCEKLGFFKSLMCFSSYAVRAVTR
ncbi:glycosyltransferase family 2 protein [Escherichia coli]|nr:glycosyltransferase family 2 protein [Escherichia coli]NUE17121.1 glycosyltransferase family 2 protein [Escherichia coli]